MENPAVFMQVAEKIKTKRIPLICTYGQVKLSGLILLNLLNESAECKNIYYSGDIDPEGIQIADKLKQRYPEKLKFFGFDIKTYEKNCSKIITEAKSIKKLEHIKSNELKELSKELEKIGKAAYEELNISELVNLVLNF